ncbi:hypothetical protein SAMN04489729_6912 [Amycolatopsis lurida]|nr:hypothetical protein SAMN04489729_6912 [Amycolatopsis lurida]
MDLNGCPRVRFTGFRPAPQPPGNPTCHSRSHRWPGLEVHIAELRCDEGTLLPATATEFPPLADAGNLKLQASAVDGVQETRSFRYLTQFSTKPGDVGVDIGPPGVMRPPQHLLEVIPIEGVPRTSGQREQEVELTPGEFQQAAVQGRHSGGRLDPQCTHNYIRLRRRTFRLPANHRPGPSQQFGSGHSRRQTFIGARIKYSHDVSLVLVNRQNENRYRPSRAQLLDRRRNPFPAGRLHIQDHTDVLAATDRELRVLQQHDTIDQVDSLKNRRRAASRFNTIAQDQNHIHGTDYEPNLARDESDRKPQFDTPLDICPIFRHGAHFRALRITNNDMGQILADGSRLGRRRAPGR